MPTLDTLSRPLEALRISVTDRCNLRCTYCMPKAIFAGHAFLKQEQLLSFSEIGQLCDIFVQLGIRKIRLTGGEPLLRPGIEDLISSLAQRHPNVELALSTNGVLLKEFAGRLRDAGLARLNVSLDALENSVFGGINGVNQSATRVLDGIDAALDLGFSVKVNMVVQRGINENQILPMARHFVSRSLSLRFIEFMDVGTCNEWKRDVVVTGAEVLERLRPIYALEPIPRQPSDVESRFVCRNTGAKFGFINSVSAPFCRDCNRLRLSADGDLYTCLFAGKGHPLGRLLRTGASREELAGTIRQVWMNRADRYSELRGRPETSRAETKVEMSFVGG